MANTIEATFGLDINPLQAGANKAQAVMKRTMESINSNVKSVSTGLGSLGGLIGLGAIAAGARSLGNFASEIKDLSETTNLSTDSFQRLSFAVEQSGGSQEVFVKAMIGIQQAMEQAKAGTGTAAASFQKLGISLMEIANGNPEKILLMIADAMKKSGGSGADFAAVADLIGVKVATKMVTSLKMGSDGFLELGASAGIASKKSIEAAEAAQDKWDEYMRKLKSLALNVATKEQLLVPMQFTAEFKDWDAKFKPGTFPQSTAAAPFAVDTGLQHGPTSDELFLPEQRALDEARQKNAEELAKIYGKIAELNLATARDGMDAAEEILSLTKERDDIASHALLLEGNLLHIYQQQGAELRLQEASINRRIAALKRSEQQRRQAPVEGNLRDLSDSLQMPARRPGRSRPGDLTFAEFGQNASLRSGGLSSGGLQTGSLIRQSAGAQRSAAHESIPNKLDVIADQQKQLLKVWTKRS